MIDTTHYPYLQRGDKNLYVGFLQTAMNLHGIQTLVDHEFGPTTEANLIKLQSLLDSKYPKLIKPKNPKILCNRGWQRLETTPFCFYETYSFPFIVNVYDSKIIDKNKTKSEMKNIERLYTNYGQYITYAASTYGVEEAAIYAILMAETHGLHADSQSKAIIRFENHYWHLKWGLNNIETFNKHWAFSQTKRWEGHTFNGEPFHGNNTKEHEVLNFASKFNKEIAHQCISMGLPQIMGSNYKIGLYESAEAMLVALTPSAGHNIAAFIHFIINSQLLPQLKSKSWYSIAKIYNGPGKAEEYSKIIENSYFKAKQYFDKAAT